LADSIVIYNALLNWFNFKIREFSRSVDLDKDLFVEALKAGREKLRKWYAILTSGAAYNIAMGKRFFNLLRHHSPAHSFLPTVLDVGWKLAFAKKDNWPQIYIDAAR